MANAVTPRLVMRGGSTAYGDNDIARGFDETNIYMYLTNKLVGRVAIAILGVLHER